MWKAMPLFFDGKKFIDFVVSKEGQDILHKYGFSPVKK